MKTLVVGATSAIAVACCRLFAAKGDELYLLGRDRERLAELAEDLRVRGAASVWITSFEAENLSGHESLIAEVLTQAGGELDRVLIAHGTLGDQQQSQASVQTCLEQMNINFMSVLALLTPLAIYFEQRGQGSIAVIGSVAGDRGRQSNYVYGAAKGGLAVFLSGLRNRLSRRGVQVLTIKPGFVDTPMTAAFTKGFLWTSPDRVARDIEHALSSQRSVLYTPGFWWAIMLVIRSIPEALFKRLSL